MERASINSGSSYGRRRIVGGLAALLATPALSATAESGPYSIVVAGPAGSRSDRWADVLVPAAGRGLATKLQVLRQNVGGIDGVTGANQFEARVEPDGTTAMLIPGAAMLSWLTGEMRAHFDPARWVPLWAGLGGAALFSRMPLEPGRRLKVAAASPVGPELPALLALDILGIEVTLGAFDPADVSAILVGPSTAAVASVATKAGMQPVMTFGAMTTQGVIGRDPDYPHVPTAAELTRGRAPREVLDVLQSTAMAVQLDVGLVLPALTRASSVAVWRRACATFASDPGIQQEASRLGKRQASLDEVTACTSGIAANSSTLLVLRRWLATRYDWRPS